MPGGFWWAPNGGPDFWTEVLGVKRWGSWLYVVTCSAEDAEPARHALRSSVACPRCCPPFKRCHRTWSRLGRSIVASQWRACLAHGHPLRVPQLTVCIASWRCRLDGSSNLTSFSCGAGGGHFAGSRGHALHADHVHRSPGAPAAGGLHPVGPLLCCDPPAPAAVR